MKYLYAFILIICFGLLHATVPILAPVDLEFILLDKLEDGRPIQYGWICRSGYQPPSKVLTITAEIVGDLIYDGPTNWTIDLATQPICTTIFHVTIPPTDTFVLVYHVDFGKPAFLGKSVLTSPITFFHNDKGEPQSTTADFRTWSDDQKALMKYHGYRYGDSALGIPAQEIPPPGYDKPRPMPPDSMGTSSSEYVSPLDQEITLKRMKERKVCAVDAEYIRVADTLFTRLRGEKLFKKIKSDTSK